jgi:hypothetical protein
VVWINLARNKEKWTAIVGTVIKFECVLCVPYSIKTIFSNVSTLQETWRISQAAAELLTCKN